MNADLDFDAWCEKNAMTREEEDAMYARVRPVTRIVDEDWGTPFDPDIDTPYASDHVDQPSFWG